MSSASSFTKYSSSVLLGLFSSMARGGGGNGHLKDSRIGKGFGRCLLVGGCCCWLLRAPLRGSTPVASGSRHHSGYRRAVRGRGNTDRTDRTDHCRSVKKLVAGRCSLL